MTGLARKVALAAWVVLMVQFLGALGIQYLLAGTIRREVVRQVTTSLEDAGALDRCTDRPGPWHHSEGWWSLWPLDASGRVVGEGPPVSHVSLPAVGQFAAWRDGEEVGAVYGTHAPACGGVLLHQHQHYPVLVARRGHLATFGLARLLLVLLSALALVAVTAVPLVRRIRHLAAAMTSVVDANFHGRVGHGADDDELAEVARAFDAAAESARERLERLEHRDRLLRHAVADLAHDLRTPLATLQLSASGLPPSAQAQTIRAELGFLEGMARNFEALLDGADGDVIESVDLHHLVRRVEHRFRPLARDRGIALEVALPDEAYEVQVPSLALERATSNLVQNALRFAQRHVVLLLFRRGHELRLEVRDDGPGMGEVSTRAAERGVRGEAQGGEGSGLGLAIAETVARRLGGRLELGDGEDGGTLAALVWPIDR